jgi:hypothetical protein
MIDRLLGYFRMGLVAMLACAGCGQSNEVADAGTLQGSHQSCAADPLACPVGETCWAGVATGRAAVCLTGGAGKAGESCQAGDVPTCGPGLTCAGVPFSGATSCLPFCDSTAAIGGCASGTFCWQTNFGDGTAGICWPIPDGGKPS